MRHKKITILFLVFWMIIIQNVLGQSRSGYGKPLSVYKTPEGLTITSYSKNWNTTSKLSRVREELLSNFHSEEISYLKNIYIYPDSPDGVLAYTHFDIGRDIRGNYIYKPNTYIEIFDGNQYKDIRELAWVLSHEYGHHFTSYYLVKKENKFFDQWRNTGYAKTRGISNHPKINYTHNYSLGNHKWDIMEIAAEDYVQLFGSTNAKKSILYKDIQQKVQEGIGNNYNYISSFNMRPQENLDIPLAAEVKGLEQYWLNLAGKTSTNIEIPPIKPQIRLVSKKEVETGYYQYRLEWDTIPGDIKYEYTLVGYPDGNSILAVPIKTVSPGSVPYATIGNFIKTDIKTGKEKLIIDDYKGKYEFRLFIKSPNNAIYSSDPFKVNFNYPIVTPRGVYKDVNITEWSYPAIKKINELNIMVGSPDKYFYPLYKVKYSEFITIMNRYIKTDKYEVNTTFESIIASSGLVTQQELNLLSKGDYMTREEIALLIYSYMALKDPNSSKDYKPTSFKDDSLILRKVEVDYLNQKGIMKGIDGYFCPQKNISRQELACILAELVKY